MPMNPSLIAAAIMLLAGVLSAVQAPTNARLAGAVGSPINAALISFGVGAAALALLALMLRSRMDLAAMRILPWHAWLGGLYGAIFVAGAAYAAPRIGVASTLIILIAGQLMAAVLIDHFGAFAVPVRAISLERLIGVCLVIAGVFLVRRG